MSDLVRVTTPEGLHTALGELAHEQAPFCVVVLTELDEPKAVDVYCNNGKLTASIGGHNVTKPNTDQGVEELTAMVYLLLPKVDHTPWPRRYPSHARTQNLQPNTPRLLNPRAFTDDT